MYLNLFVWKTNMADLPGDAQGIPTTVERPTSYRTKKVITKLHNAAHQPSLPPQHNR